MTPLHGTQSSRAHSETRFFTSSIEQSAEYAFFRCLRPRTHPCCAGAFSHASHMGWCTLEENTLIIVAVAHLHRKPRYWADRL